MTEADDSALIHKMLNAFWSPDAHGSDVETMRAVLAVVREHDGRAFADRMLRKTHWQQLPKEPQ